MKSNLADFKRKLRREARKAVDTMAKDAQVSVARYCYEKFILRTPVLTGHARHNWIATVGDPYLQEIAGVFGGDETGEPLTAFEKSHFRQAAQELHKLPLGQTFYLVNNAPYIERLEAGYSGKAPSGMVEITLAEVLEGVQISEVKSDDGGV